MGSKYSLRISKTAEKDLEDIYQYIYHKAKTTKTGKKVLRDIQESILSLKRFPKRNQVILGYPYLRRVIIYSYSIIYYIDSCTDEVYIVRILSNHTNWNQNIA